MFTRLDDDILVAGQIEPGDVAAAKAAGVTTIVNNRPDGEAPGQPAGAEIAAAARSSGLRYVAIPITQAGFSREQIDAMTNALRDSDGAVLAFCRSGTRSTLLWALTRAQAGDDYETIAGKAAAAGYDVAPIRPLLS